MDSISALSWLGIGQKLRGTEWTRGLPGLSHGVFSLRQFQLLGELIPGMKSGDSMRLDTYTFLRFMTHNLVAVLFELAHLRVSSLASGSSGVVYNVGP